MVQGWGWPHWNLHTCIYKERCFWQHISNTENSLSSPHYWLQKDCWAICHMVPGTWGSTLPGWGPEPPLIIAQGLPRAGAILLAWLPSDPADLQRCIFFHRGVIVGKYSRDGGHAMMGEEDPVSPERRRRSWCSDVAKLFKKTAGSRHRKICMRIHTRSLLPNSRCIIINTSEGWCSPSLCKLGSRSALSSLERS